MPRRVAFPTLLAAIVAAVAALVAGCGDADEPGPASAANPAAAAHGDAAWRACGGGDRAASRSGLKRIMDRDPVLRRAVRATTVGAPRPSTVMQLTTSLCGDLNGDGVVDRAVYYQLPGLDQRRPTTAAVLVGRVAKPPRIVWLRNRDRVVRSIEPDGDGLTALELLYAPGDPPCCATRERVHTIRGGAKGRVVVSSVIRDAPRRAAAG